jgi:membrane-bound serine protease (ClpP class)
MRARRPRRSPFATLAAAIAAALALRSPAPARADDAPAGAATYAKVRVVDFEGEIGASIAAYVGRALERAKADGVGCLVLRIESPGGTVLHSEKIADALMALPRSLRTVAWIPHHAYSGAAMVALACDEIVMTPEAVVGDCQPIFLTPGGITPVGEKAESPLRAQFRRMAEDNGYPALLAEKMVSQDFEVVEVRERDGTTHYVRGDEWADSRDEDLVDGVPKSSLKRVSTAVPKDKLLTMTTKEAQRFGFVRRVVATEADLVRAVSAPGADVSYVEMTLSERVGRWLLGVSGVLSAIVLLCLGLTLFNGVGTLTFVGLGALALLLLVGATAELENGAGLVLLGVGIALLALEAFVIPGFGIAGILGILAVLCGLFFVSTGTSFSGGSEAPTGEAIKTFAIQATVAFAAGLALLVGLARFFPSMPLARRGLLLQGAGLVPGRASPPPGPASPLVNLRGVALTPLRPAGRAAFPDPSAPGAASRHVDVVAEGGFVETGGRVRVVRVEGPSVVVRAETAS